MSKIYYWANNIKPNTGEGILALNFLILLKKKYNNYKLIKINRFQHRETFFYNYFLPFFGILKIWYYHLKGKKVCYVNYLPIWNFLIFITLPKKTILGPVTGSNQKENIIYKVLKNLGVYFLKRKEKILFSHSQFRKYFKNRDGIYYDFIL